MKMLLSITLQVLFLSSIAGARPYDFCEGQIKSTGAKVTFMSSFGDGSPQELLITLKTQVPGQAGDLYVPVTKNDNSYGRIYSRAQNPQLELSIDGKTCTSSGRQTQCVGVAQIDTLGGGFPIVLKCIVNIPYSPASGGNCTSNPHCH